MARERTFFAAAVLHRAFPPTDGGSGSGDRRTLRRAEGHNSCLSDVFMNATPPNPSRALRMFAAAAKVSLWLLLAPALLLALARGALHEFIVPRIGELRPALEIRASRALGVPVRIGSISAVSEGLIPSFTLRDVV